MTVTLHDLARLQEAEMHKARVFKAIQDQLDELEALFHQYSPRKIGRHHPEYVPDTKLLRKP